MLDRLVLRPEPQTRLAGSFEQAFREGGGRAVVEIQRDGRPPDVRRYGEQFGCQACGTTLERPQPLLFSFNHPLGACPECKGFGNLLRYDEGRVIPDPGASLAGGAVEPWRHPSGEWYQKELLRVARRRKIDVHRPYAELPETVRRWVNDGDKDFCGIRGFFEEVEGYRYKLHVRVFLSRYRSQVPCPTCGGARLKPEALAVTVAGRSIAEVARLAIDDLAGWLAELPLTAWEAEVGREVVDRLAAKVSFLRRVGLGYLTVERQMRTLSGGEAQRIALATQLGAQLVGTLYVLDEPSIGLHARDVTRLAELCRELAHAGNTVVVVEHDRTFIEAADHCVELGPGSGERGGEIVLAAPRDEFLRDMRTLTARYLSGRESIPLPVGRREGDGRWLTVVGAREHNLRNVRARIPLRNAHVRHGRLRLGQVDAGARHALPSSGARVQDLLRGAGRARRAAGARASARGAAHRPGADRPDAAVESGHVHQGVRRRPAPVRGPAEGEDPRARAGALLVQRPRGPLRDLRGRRLREARDVLLRGRLRHVPRVRGAPLPPGRPPGRLPGARHQPGAPDDGRRGHPVLRGHGRA